MRKKNHRSSALSEMTSGRREFLVGSAAGVASIGASAAPVIPESWRKEGATFTNYGQSRQDRSSPIRWISANPVVPGEGVSWTPLHELAGTITPNGLHFERHHNGIPNIDVETWQFVMHGLVNRPTAFNLNSLNRYPQISQTVFIECGGNSNALWRAKPVQTAAGYLHGLVSCAEWTGVLLSTLMRATKVATTAKWLVADGLDASGVTVSLPLDNMPDNTMVALYQNGEPLRSANGFPARLLVPGWEGVTHVKWLRSIEFTDQPVMSKFDTVSYTDLLPSGISNRFSFEMGVKSVITSPSPGVPAQSGLQEIRGLAWVGGDRIKRVEVSVDGGKSWQDAQLQGPILKNSLTRFRMAWRHKDDAVVIMSRATDYRGNTQPSRTELIKAKGTNSYYHFNAIVSWAISIDGRVSHVYV